MRYLFEDVSDNTYKEQSVWTYLDFTYALKDKTSVRARYDYVSYLDERDSTLQRQPSPEHWLWLELEAHF
jgi:hypothetical protein